MRILGVILAGGAARRFGSDKAHALYQGERLIDIVGKRLNAQCAGVVVCGRAEPGYDCVPDRPAPDYGPLGGINAALHFGRDQGYETVLSAACDIPNLPSDLYSTLAGEGAAIVQSQPVVGLWPIELADRLEPFLAEGGRKLFDFALLVGARMVRFDPPLMNVNRPQDLPQ